MKKLMGMIILLVVLIAFICIFQISVTGNRCGTFRAPRLDDPVGPVAEFDS